MSRVKTVDHDLESETPENTKASSGNSNPDRIQSSQPHTAHSFRPLKRPGYKAYGVADEAILVHEQGASIYALNATGAQVWDLCDGRHSLIDIHQQLGDQYDGDKLLMMADVSAALFRLNALDLLDPGSLSDQPVEREGVVDLASSGAPGSKVHIVNGIEDRPYFHWQLAILFESLVGQLPAGWDIRIVVCNNHRPLSPELTKILETYQVEHYTGESHADNHHIDFAGGGDRYVPMNRVEALNIVSQHVAPEDLVCLMDSDIFLYGELQRDLFPQGNAMASNWIIGQEKYFQFSVDDTKGLNLPKLLEALGCDQEFKPGGVMVFLTGETLQRNDRKVIRDCFRFLQIHFLAGKILDLPSHGVWVAEMACFAMAMYPNGIDYELLDIEQFAVQEQFANELPEGTFFHYYTDLNDEGSRGPFYESQWHKQLFASQNFLEADIDSFLDVAQGKAEICFMNLAKRARDRLYEKS